MLSLRASMHSNFLMISLLLFCFSIIKVFSQNPITNIQVLDNYLSGASKFAQNRSPIFDGITLVLPKPPVHHSPHLRHHSHYNRPHHRIQPFLPQALPNLHPLSFPLSSPLQSHVIPHQFHPILLSPAEAPNYQPVFRSVILPNFDKYRKHKKSSYKSKYRPPKDYYYKHYHNKQSKRNRKYPKSISEKLRQKDNEEEEEEKEEETNEKEGENDPENEEDPLDDPHNEEFEKPVKSYYDNLPPYGKPKTVFQVKSPMSLNGSKDYENSESPQTYSKSNGPPQPPQHSQQKSRNRMRKPILQSDWSPNNQKDDHQDHHHSGDNDKSQSLFDRSPPFSTPDQFNFLKPMIQKNNKNKSLLSDSPEMLSTSDYRKESPKKQRTATANQLSLKGKDNHSHKNPFKEERSEPKVHQSIPKDDLESNDDPNFYPHQYAIEIRWKDRNNIHYNLDAPKGDVGDREMHSSKELDHARHRKYKHEEEEHWHEKKWLKEGLRKAYLNGKHLPIRLVQPKLNLPNGDFSPLPIYAQPLHNGATLDEINQHFAIPTPNFRVNNRFMEWAKNSIPINPLQNMNNILLYG